MPYTIYKVLDGFPFPAIAPIIGSPNHKNISELHMKLNSNAASVQSNLGNDALGLLYLTVSPTFYTTLLVAPLVVPVNPGSELIIPNGTTGPVIMDFCYDLQLANDIFTEYDWTDKALRQILLASVDKL